MSAWRPLPPVECSATRPARRLGADISSELDWAGAMSGRIENQPDWAGASDWEVRQEEFVSANMRRVFLIIYRIVGNVSDAQDLTQETFIKALQKQEQIKDLEKAAHWLSRIASNTAIDFLRRQGRMGETGLDEVTAPVAVPAERNPEALLLRAERFGYLEAGLSRLTSRERTALILRDVEDLPAEEVARRLNCGKATVRSHIANARIKFASGCVANVTASRISRDRTRKIRFFQRDAYISIDCGAREAEVYRLMRYPDRRPAIEGGRIEVPDTEPLRNELQDFVDAVRFGRAPLVGGRDGRRAVALAAEITERMAAAVRV